MQVIDACSQDVMQVCRNGHVITDLLRTCPERGQGHCDRCGAETLDRCLTCGQELAGAVAVPGLVPVGRPKPPQHCSGCGAAFPWAAGATPAAPPALATLETMLRRLPRTVRQLRFRHGDRPPFRVTDEYDLEDLLRALLPLHFDDVRPEGRTPTYAGTRTDFLLVPEAVAVTAKLARPRPCDRQVLEQVEEDVAYYERPRGCGTLVAWVYDPDGSIREPGPLETACSKLHSTIDLRCIISG
jgi:hypothetical protein